MAPALGLAIARAIVRSHGGTIAAGSDGPEKGATVTIRLPVRGMETRSAAMDARGRDGSRGDGKATSAVGNSDM